MLSGYGDPSCDYYNTSTRFYKNRQLSGANDNGFDTWGFVEKVAAIGCAMLLVKWLLKGK